MPKILLVRHGITKANMGNKFAGQTDIDLAEEGIRQAEKLGERLAKTKIDAIYSSDLKRASHTADAIASRHEKEIIRCGELREMNYGEAEGLTYDEIREQLPEVADAMSKFDLNLISFPGGESMRALTVRGVEFLKRLNDYDGDETVLIVSHGGMLRTLLCEMLEIGQENWQKFRFDNCSLTIVDIYPRRAILSLLNDTSHLKQDG